MQTTGKGYEYPDTTDNVSAYPGVAQTNALLDDARPGVSVVTTVQRNAYAGTDLWTGRIIWNTTNNRLERYTGASWEPALVVEILTDTQRDALAGADLFAGRIIFNSTSAQFQVYDGANWRNAGAVQVLTTTQRTALAGDDLFSGLEVFDSTATTLYVYDGATWQKIGVTLATTVTGPDALSTTGSAAVVGTSTSVARADHDHGLPAAFDGTAPVTQAFGDAAATGAASVAARRDHRHGMPAAPTAAALTLISSSVLGADAASVTFSSIPSSYHHLDLLGSHRSTASSGTENTCAQFNGDTATNYDIAQDDSSQGANNAASMFANWHYDTPSDNIAAAGVWGQYQLRALAYSQTTTQKVGSMSSGFNSVGSWHAQVALSWVWRSTSAISSVKVFMNTGSNIKAGSSDYLYGVN